MYPKHQPDAGVPASPSLPALERDVLDYWAGDKTFQASVDARDAGPNGRQRVRLLRRPAVRQRPAALRPPAHRLREGPRAALPDDARPPRRAPVRLGLPRPARRGRGREAARHHDEGGDPRARHGQVQRRLPHARCCSTPRTGSGTSPARPAGSTSTTTTRRSTPDYMESVMWAFKTLHDKGLVYEGFRVLAYCWRCETPLSNTETRMDDVYQDRQDPALTVGVPAGDRREARWSGRRRRGRCRPTWRSRSAPTSTTRCSSRTAQRVHPRRGARLARTRRSSPTTSRSARSRAASWSAARTRRCSTSWPTAARTRSRCSAATSSSTEDGTGVVHMAPAFGEDDQNVCLAAGIPTVVTVDDRARFTSLVPPYQGMQVFEANKPIMRDLKDREAWCSGTRATRTRTRTAGAVTRR